MVIKRYVQKAKLESGEVVDILVEVEGINASRMGYPEEWVDGIKQAYHLGDRLYWNNRAKCWELIQTGGKPIRFFPID